MKTILILDDDPAVRESFCDYFEDQGWNVVQADSGEVAFKILNSEAVDAAVVDMRLPGIDGNEFIRQVIGVTEKVAFIICTGSPEYVVPKDLLNKNCVSKLLMKKPVISFGELEGLILQTMKEIKSEDDGDNE